MYINIVKKKCHWVLVWLFEFKYSTVVVVFLLCVWSLEEKLLQQTETRLLVKDSELSQTVLKALSFFF